MYRVVLLLIILGIIVSGCGRGGESLIDKRIIARINNYELTVSDFNNEIGSLLMRKYLARDPLKAKEELLEQLITKKVLLQEAQRQNFDKDRNFMREIERYWEQALLKLLLKKKSDELSKTITVTDSEVLDEYMKMKRKILVEIITLEDRDSQVTTAEPAEWYSLGDLPIQLEEIAFSLKPGEMSEPIEFSGNWVVVKVLEEKAVELDSLENMEPDIKMEILRRKRESALEEWINQLRGRAKVSIDKDVLKEVDL